MNERAPAATEAHTIPNKTNRYSMCVLVHASYRMEESKRRGRHSQATNEENNRETGKSTELNSSHVRHNDAEELVGYCWQTSAHSECVSASAIPESMCNVYGMACLWRDSFRHAHVLAKHIPNRTHNAHINRPEFMRSYLHTNYDYFDPIRSDPIRCTDEELHVRFFLHFGCMHVQHFREKWLSLKLPA